MDFQLAIPKTLEFEGGFQKDPRDLGNWVGGKVVNGKVVGGKLVGTKYGIAARYFPDEDIPNLTIPRAVVLYRRKYWALGDIDRLPPHLRFTVFDMGVNAGVSRAIKGLQVLSQYPNPTPEQLRVAVDYMLSKRKASINGLAIDGIMGPNTARAAANVTLQAYTALRLAYYERIAGFRQNHVYLRTWRRRANDSDKFTIQHIRQQLPPTLPHESLSDSPTMLGVYLESVSPPPVDSLMRNAEPDEIAGYAPCPDPCENCTCSDCPSPVEIDAPPPAVAKPAAAGCLPLVLLLLLIAGCSARLTIEDSQRPVDIKVRGSRIEREQLIEVARQTLTKPDTVRLNAVPNLFAPGTQPYIPPAFNFKLPGSAATPYLLAPGQLGIDGPSGCPTGEPGEPGYPEP